MKSDSNNIQGPVQKFLPRAMTPKDMILAVSGLIGAISAILIGLGTIADALPFVQKHPYAMDWAANDHELQGIRSDHDKDHETVSALVRNSQLSLQIQMQTKVDALAATLKHMPTNDPDRPGIKATFDDYNQKLTILNRDLEK